MCWLSLKLQQKQWYHDKDDDNDDDDKDGWPAQVLELQKNDRLHLQTSSYYTGVAHDIIFCVHLISAN